MKRLLSLFGLDARVHRLRIAISEGALAAEDRAQLLRMVWQEEQHRLRTILLFVIAVIGLSTVAAALLSIAVIVHFWDTSYRASTAWGIAFVWVVLWIAAVIVLMSVLRASSRTFAIARAEFEEDWRWIQAQIGARERGPGHRERRPATRGELLARIDRQRERIAQLQAIPPENTAGGKSTANKTDESLSAKVIDVAREYPLATAAVAAGTVLALGPRRIARLAAWLTPILWKMR